MGYTWEDAQQEVAEESYIAEVLEHHRDTIVAEFIEERLASYYEDHPMLCAAAEAAQTEAKSLIAVSKSASLVFSMAAVEITIRDVLLKPVVAGLTHDPNVSDLIADLIDSRFAQAEKILLFIMSEVGLPGLEKQKLDNGKLVWAEKKALQELRNRIVHRGATVSEEEANRAMELSIYFLNRLFPTVRDRFTSKSTGWV